MARKILAAGSLAAVAAAVLMVPGAANAANTSTTLSLDGWYTPPTANHSGTFTAVSKTLCNSGTWITFNDAQLNGYMTLTCADGDTITFAQGAAKYKGHLDGVFNYQSGTGAYGAGTTAQLFFVQDSGSTGIWSGNVS